MLFTKELRTKLAAISVFAAKNDDRYYLNGVHLKATGGALIIEATDGHALARTTVAIDETDAFDVVIKNKDIKAILDGTKTAEAVDVIASNDAVEFIGDFNYMCKPVAGKFPDTNRVIPADDRPFNPEGGIGLDAKYLDLVFKCRKTALGRGNKPAGIVFRFGDSTSPVKIEFDDYIIVVATMRF